MRESKHCLNEPTLQRNGLIVEWNAWADQVPGSDLCGQLFGCPLISDESCSTLQRGLLEHAVVEHALVTTNASERPPQAKMSLVRDLLTRWV